MKIALLTSYYPSPRHMWDGRSAHETVKELAKMADVRVFLPLSRYPKWVQRFKPLPDEKNKDFVPDGPPVTFHYYPAAPLISRALNGRAIANALSDEVRAWRPDVILSYVIYPSGYGAVEVGKRLGIPVVITATGSDLNRNPGPLIYWQRRHALRHADMVQTVSHDLARTAVTLGAHAADTHAILNGCDTTLFYPQDRLAARQLLGLPADQEIALYVGRYDVRKGLVELIEAAAELRQRRPHLHTYLLGSGPDENVLRDCIQQFSVQDVVHLAPPVSGDRVATWNAAADIGVLPSYMEGCPNVIVETLASGRPVVATNVGGIPELVDDTCGRLVPARAAQPLAAAIDEVLSLHWDASEISRAHSRSWKDVAVQMYEGLEHAIERGRRGRVSL